MGIFDIFRKKDNSNLFTQEELRAIIDSLYKLGLCFQNSTALIAAGENRNKTMNSKTYSYCCIFGYYYEVLYKYGSFSKIVSADIANHFLLVKMAMSNEEHRKSSIGQLSDNWSDVLNTIHIIRTSSQVDEKNFKAIDDNIKSITEAIERLSGIKCTIPKSHRHNPYSITENKGMSEGHGIPDLSSVFAGELLPHISKAEILQQNKADVVAAYAIYLIKSYYDKASFVPMCIVESIIEQIEKAICGTPPIDYSPSKDLKQYVLSKIYY